MRTQRRIGWIEGYHRSPWKLKLLHVISTWPDGSACPLGSSFCLSSWLLCCWSVHESTFDNPADDTHVSIYIYLARLLYGYCILDIIVHSGNLLSYVRLTITITVEIFVFVAVFQSVNQPKRCELKIHQQPTLGMCCTINK